MRIVFMGTPAFALPALDALAHSTHDLVCVYTRPDAASGRGKALRPSPVKARAEELGAEVRCPASLRDEDEQAALAELACDLVVVAAYGLILPREVLDIPRLGCVNIHGSLLPRWRGAAPVQRAVLAGDAQVGACLMRMEEGLDTGVFHEAGRTEVGLKGAAELSDEIAHMGAAELVRALPAIEDGSYVWERQDDAQATYAEKIEKAELLLDPGLSCAQFMRRVQASGHSAPARCVVCGRETAVLAARPADDALAAGGVCLGKKRIALGCADGAVEILQVKPQGKKAMEASAWAAGLSGAQERCWYGVGK